MFKQLADAPCRRCVHKSSGADQHNGPHSWHLREVPYVTASPQHHRRRNSRNMRCEGKNTVSMCSINLGHNTVWRGINQRYTSVHPSLTPWLMLLHLNNNHCPFSRGCQRWYLHGNLLLVVPLGLCCLNTDKINLHVSEKRVYFWSWYVPTVFLWSIILLHCVFINFFLRHTSRTALQVSTLGMAAFSSIILWGLFNMQDISSMNNGIFREILFDFVSVNLWILCSRCQGLYPFKAKTPPKQ